MPEVAISLKNVSKCFKRYHRPVDRLKEILLPGKIKANEFWALREIDLEVNRGEALGIIGQNGAGKSTLLQIVAGTLTATTGVVKVNGRVSALLELGSGFNPEFTGRQNVFFNGRILGLSQKEIEEKFDEIAAFAGIGDFIDQPVKTYSSGMFVRLAFAVAVSSAPDILIIDEALAVGDVYFQQKCFEKIKKLKKSGTTLLFVSHDTTAVYKICETAILFELGQMILKADPKHVIDLYEAKLLKKNDAQPEALEIQTSSASSQDGDTLGNSEEVAVTSSEVRIEFVHLLNENNQKIDSCISSQFVQISIGILFLKAFEGPIVGFKIRDRTGFTIFENHTYNLDQPIGSVTSNTSVNILFGLHVPLIEGEYTITIGVADSGFGEGQFTRALAYVHNTAVLTVLKDKNAAVWGGIVNLNPCVAINRQTHV